MVDGATSFGGSTVGYTWAYDTPQSLVFWFLNFKIYQNSYAFYLKNKWIPVSIQFPIFKFVLGVFIMTPRLIFSLN